MSELVIEGVDDNVRPDPATYDMPGLIDKAGAAKIAYEAYLASIEPKLAELEAEAKFWNAAALQRLAEQGVTSAKGSIFKATRTVKTGVVDVVDRMALDKWVKKQVEENPAIYDPNVYLSTNLTAVKNIIKETGEKAPGIEFKTTEYVSIKPQEEKQK